MMSQSKNTAIPFVYWRALYQKVVNKVWQKVMQKHSETTVKLACQLKAMNMDLANIKEATGLSEDEINNL